MSAEAAESTESTMASEVAAKVATKVAAKAAAKVAKFANVATKVATKVAAKAAAKVAKFANVAKVSKVTDVGIEVLRWTEVLRWLTIVVVVWVALRLFLLGSRCFAPSWLSPCGITTVASLTVRRTVGTIEASVLRHVVRSATVLIKTATICGRGTVTVRIRGLAVDWGLWLLWSLTP